jgi:hypothetical protein
MPVISGYITRSNLPTGALGNLAIFNSTYMGLFGDDSQAADSSSDAGIDPGASSAKYTWADSPFVAGQQLVNYVQDNRTLYLRFLVAGANQGACQTNLSTIITAVTQQMTYQVSVTLDTSIYTWTCYPAEYQIAMNQWMWFGPGSGGGPPLYLSIPRDPTPVAGPI